MGKYCPHPNCFNCDVYGIETNTCDYVLYFGHRKPETHHGDSCPGVHIRSKKRKKSQFDQKKAYDMKQAGYSLTEIAAELGVSKDSIKTFLTKVQRWQNEQ